MSNGNTITFGDATSPGDADAGDGTDQVDQNMADDAAAILGTGSGSQLPLINQDNSAGPADTAYGATNDTSAILGQTNDEVILDTQDVGAGFTTSGINMASFHGQNISSQFDGNVSSNPGAMLVFSFGWPNAVDLDGFVTDPEGNTLCVFEDTRPNCVFSSSNGGSSGQDKTGPNATEVIQWTGNLIPNGDYEYGMHYF